MFNCSNEFLEFKPDKALVVPTTLEDFQALLDNFDVMNTTPALGMMASDESFTTYSAWLETYTATEKNCYTWSRDTYEGMLPDDWVIPYKQIFYANIVLEGVDNITITPFNEAQRNSVRGTALFIRGYALFQLAELFTAPYDHTKSALQKGLPIRTSADVNKKVVRASQLETYDQIASDLQAAALLLPDNVLKKTRPLAAAANAALARLNLYRANYKETLKHASAALSANSKLIDYNKLNTAQSRTMGVMNDEVLFYAQMVSYSYSENSTTYVDTTLFEKPHFSGFVVLIAIHSKETTREDLVSLVE